MCAGLLLAVCGVLLLGCGGDALQEGSPKVLASKPTREVGRDALENFALLRGSTEPLPAGLTRQLPPVEGGWTIAQRLPIVTQLAWAVPGPERLCLVVKGRNEPPSVVCARISHAVKAGMFLASVPANAQRTSKFRTVIGVVPDGVSEVRIHASGARPRLAPVVENVFVLRDHGRAFPESIELVRRNRAR